MNSKLGIVFTVFAVLLSSCSIHQQIKRNQPQAGNPEPEIKQTVLNITDSVMLKDFELLDGIYLDETDENLNLLQRKGNKTSAVSVFNLAQNKTLYHDAYDAYIEKIKPTHSGILLFYDKGITKLDKTLKEEYRIKLPETVKLVHDVDLSADEKQIIYIDKAQQNIYRDTHPLTQPTLVMSAESTKGAGSFFDISFLGNDLIYFSYQTEQLPFGAGICNTKGESIWNKQLNNTMPKLAGNQLLLYQSMEYINDNKLYIYDLNSPQNSPKIVITNDKAETVSTTISSNGKFLLTASTDENGENVTLRVYNQNSEIIHSITISNNVTSGVVNLMGTDTYYAICNSGKTAYILLDDEESRKLLQITFG